MIMSQETIKKLGDELIRLCDGIESHGLVDYQYGVWEDRIETSMSFAALPLLCLLLSGYIEAVLTGRVVLEECLDLYDSLEAAVGTSGGSR